MHAGGNAAVNAGGNAAVNAGGNAAAAMPHELLCGNAACWRQTAGGNAAAAMPHGLQLQMLAATAGGNAA